MKITNEEFERQLVISQKVDLSIADYNDAKSFFLKCQASFTPPHTWIPKVTAALQSLEHHKPNKLNFFQKPLGLIIIAGFGGVFTYSILLLLGWVSLPSQ